MDNSKLLQIQKLRVINLKQLQSKTNHMVVTTNRMLKEVQTNPIRLQFQTKTSRKDQTRKTYQ